MLMVLWLCSMGERIEYSNEDVATHLSNLEPSLLPPGILPDNDYSPDRKSFPEPHPPLYLQETGRESSAPNRKSLLERFVHSISNRLSHIGREGFQVILGAIWIVDGLLQLQPYMYEKGSNGLFGTVALETMGRPNALNDFLAFMVRHMVAHEAISNTSIVLVQVAIGALLVWSGLRKCNQVTRVTLAVSIAWAFMVWVVGEGVGGMIMPQASMLTGAPGAAILYVLAAIYLWPPKDHPEDITESHVPADIRHVASNEEREVSDDINISCNCCIQSGGDGEREVPDDINGHDNSVALPNDMDGYSDNEEAAGYIAQSGENMATSPTVLRDLTEATKYTKTTKYMAQSGENPTNTLSSHEEGAVANHGLLGTTGSYIAWTILWCGSSLLEFQYGNFAPNSISAQIRYEATGEPRWLSFMDLHLASILRGNGTVLAGILLVAEFAVGWLALRPATRKIALIAGISLATLFWVVGQNLGTVFSGQATDLNSGPLLILLALLLWPRGMRHPGRHFPVFGNSINGSTERDENDQSMGREDADLIHA